MATDTRLRASIFLYHNSAPDNLLTDPATILSLHRLQTTLGSGSYKLPKRLLLPHIPTFVEIPPHLPQRETPRIRTPLPLPLHHPFLLKSAFPVISVEYQEDWDDY